MLLEHGGIMGTVKLVEVGDRCRIEDPMWKNLHGTVVKIDRGRKRCCIDIYFDDAHRTVWTGYDLVKPENELSGVAGSYE